MAHVLDLADSGLVPGQILLEKYRVESVIGAGGMGVVARCTHLALNEQVAIKMLRREMMTDRDAVGRFMREAQAVSKLKSEYVARVTDVGEFDDGVPYMVMEYLEGHDLGAVMDQSGSLSVPWTCELMLQTCEALAEAHSLGIVHRDVKPSNLFVTWRPDGTALVKVLDFGISKSASSTDMQLTQTQSLLGTPAYMSPEQMRSASRVDGRTDIWSLGTVLYELIEGRRPFEADSFSEMCVKVAVDAPSPMLKAPPELQAVVMKCLAKTPDERYATVADFARELVPFAPDEHAANRLVERMVRVIGRRSGGDWDASSNPSITPRPTPMPMAARGSAPVIPRAQSPALGAIPTSVDTQRDASVPVRVPVELTTQHPPASRSRVPLITAAGSVGVIAIGIVIGISLSGKASAPSVESTTVVTPTVTLPTPVTPPVIPTTPPVIPTTPPDQTVKVEAAGSATRPITPITPTTQTAVTLEKPTGTTKPKGGGKKGAGTTTGKPTGTTTAVAKPIDPPKPTGTTPTGTKPTGTTGVTTPVVKPGGDDPFATARPHKPK